MKTFLALLIASTGLASISWAQRTATSGFGNVGHPGSVGVTQVRPGGFRAGTRPVRGYAAYPVFIGGAYYGDGYGSGYGYGPGYGNGYAQQVEQPPINVTVVNAPPQAPTVIINQNFGPRPDSDQSDSTHIYQPAPPSSDSADVAPQVHYFLVAFKDHSVYSALAYWIEGNTLHYVTPQQTHNQASLDLVDLDFTKKLNQR